MALACGTLSLATVPGAQGRPRQVTLRDCVELALKLNPSAAVEEARLEEAGADEKAAWAALLPRFGATALYNRLNPSRLAPFGGGPAGGLLFAQEAFAGVTGRYVFFDGLKSTSTRTAALRAQGAQRHGVAATQADVVLLVTQQYVRLLQAERAISVAREAVARQRAFEELAAARFRAGRGSRLDPLRAESQRLEAERALVTAIEGREIAQVLLRKAIGLEAAQPLSPADELPRALATPEAESAILDRALAREWELLRLSEQIRQAEAGLRAARGGRFPEVSLQMAVGLRYNDLGGTAPEWSTGILLGWPLFEGGAVEAQVDKARSRLRQARESRRARVLEVQGQVREALAGWRIGLASARAATKIVETCREAVTTATALYEAGMVPALDVLTAQAELTRAEAEHIQALGEVVVAKARVERLAGKS